MNTGEYQQRYKDARLDMAAGRWELAAMKLQQLAADQVVVAQPELRASYEDAMAELVAQHWGIAASRFERLLLAAGPPSEAAPASTAPLADQAGGGGASGGGASRADAAPEMLEPETRRLSKEAQADMGADRWDSAATKM